MSTFCCLGRRSVPVARAQAPRRPEPRVARLNPPHSQTLRRASEQRSVDQIREDDRKTDSPQTRHVDPNTYPPFSYVFRLPSRHIRLLQINPGQDKAAIHCSISTADLDGSPAFDALSYTWDSNTKSSSIVCNGKALNITDNLFNALWQFRHSKIYGAIWIDAVCINQDDIVEKTAQVKMMMQIYQHAALVRVWLGNLGAGFESFSEEDLETFHRFSRTVDQFLDRNNPSELFVDFIAVERNIDLRSDMHAVLRLLTRSWFSRMWIIQELLAAKNCEFHLGPYKLDRDEVLRVAGAMETSKGKNFMLLSKPSHPLRDGTGVAPSLAKMNALYAKGSRLRLSELVRRTGLFRATEEKDNIFALVGLASDADEDFIDYGKDTRALFIDVARNALTRPNQSEAEGLDFLCKVQAPDPEARFTTYDGVPQSLRDADMPSWAPVLSKTTMIWGDIKPLSELWPGPGHECCLKPECRLGPDETLHVRGKLVTVPRVIVMDNPYDWPLQFTEDSQAQFSQLKSWIDAVKKLCWDELRKEDEDDKTLIVRTAWYAELSQALVFSSVLPTGADTAPVPPFFYRLCFFAFSQYVDVMSTGTYGDAFEFATRVANESFKNEFGQDPGFEPIVEGDLVRYTEAFATCSRGRRFCVMQTKHIAWVPAATRLRDFVVKIQGLRVPLLLRTDSVDVVHKTHRADGAKFTILGDSYIHGMMFAECEKHGRIIPLDSQMLVIV